MSPQGGLWFSIISFLFIICEFLEKESVVFFRCLRHDFSSLQTVFYQKKKKNKNKEKQNNSTLAFNTWPREKEMVSCFS